MHFCLTLFVSFCYCSSIPDLHFLVFYDLLMAGEFPFLWYGGREKRKEKKRKKKTAHNFCTPGAPLEIHTGIHPHFSRPNFFSTPSVAHLDIFLLFYSTPRISKASQSSICTPGSSSPDLPERRTFHLLPTSVQV